MITSKTLKPEIYASCILRQPHQELYLSSEKL